jgi:hypothetical protein
MLENVRALMDLGWAMRDLHVVHENFALQEMTLDPEDAV